MFQGLRTTIYRISDIQSAKQWYSEILRSKPYFESPSYVGYNIGGFELTMNKK